MRYGYGVWTTQSRNAAQCIQSCTLNSSDWASRPNLTPACLKPKTATSQTHATGCVVVC
ncbi:hypothetical protein RRSWK_03463 [Rhodopirellula sp. SWK7]|nr:hypothetical protein RRSWK_03463 [Rhodopirellula sp. SWK7]